MDKQSTMSIVIVGHVDHGKSTLIGRIFYDTGSLPVERYNEIEAVCKRQGREFEFAYLMDALEEEREQNVTIETAQTFFKTKKRDYVIIDAPGHKEFLKNMITGSSTADAAILLVDADEGVREQTRRHSYILSLLGIRSILVAINKMDLVEFQEDPYEKVSGQITRFLHSLGMVISYVVPISAKQGDNVQASSEKMPWYNGPTILGALDAFNLNRNDDRLPLRFPIQDIYKWDNKRIYVGRLETGSLRVGQQIVIAPTGKTSKIKSIEGWKTKKLLSATAGQSIGLTLEDELFIERGHVIAGLKRGPLGATDLSVSLFWLGRKPLVKGGKYRLRLGTVEVEAQVVTIMERIDSSTLDILERDASEVEYTESANLRLSLKHAIAADPFDENMRLGRFVLVADGRVSGGGIIRAINNEQMGAAHRVVRLSDAVTTWPEPNLIDLRNENALVELEADRDFLESLRQGERYIFRMLSVDHLPPLTRLAYENDLVFTFRREDYGVSVLLRSKEKKHAAKDSRSFMI